MTSASKVGDLFTAAGEAFSKLAELTCLLQTTPTNGSYNETDGSATGWSANDTELLRLAVKRFGDELNVISEHIKDKTMCQIKTTFKKIHPSLNTSKSEEDVSRSAITDDSMAGSRVSSMCTVSASDGRLPGGITSISPVSEPLSTATSASAMPLQTAMTHSAAPTTTSICPSPSPFLHYPLLRKSADITLNMLNARDDSDDEDRMGLSMFNSV